MVGAVIGARRSTPRVVAIIDGTALGILVASSLIVSRSLTASHSARLLSFVAAMTALAIIGRALADAEARSRRASVLDPLTGLLNRAVWRIDLRSCASRRPRAARRCVWSCSI
jgi:hypothetical protein